MSEIETKRHHHSPPQTSKAQEATRTKLHRELKTFHQHFKHIEVEKNESRIAETLFWINVEYILDNFELYQKHINSNT